MVRIVARMWRMLLVVGLLAVAVPVGAQSAASARLEPNRATVGATVTIAGSGWPASRAVTVTFGGMEYFDWVTGASNADGSLRLSAVVPRQYRSLAGQQVLVGAGDYVVNIISAPGPDRSTIAVAVTLTVVEPPATPATIAARFRDYYFAHDGGRLLGGPISAPRLEDSRIVQYFEKGRLEDHQGEASSATWRVQYGRLGSDLATIGRARPVGGDTSSVTYATLKDLAQPERRVPPPPGWTALREPEGEAGVFVPVDTSLSAAPGHSVPARFWGYLTQPDLFPAGWLHDIGLPLTPAVPALVTKTVNGERVERPITVQLFERTVLTDDPANPAGFQIERANVGSDYLADWVGPVVPGDIALLPVFAWEQPRLAAENVPLGMRAPAWEWRSRAQPNVRMEMELPRLQRLLDSEGWSVVGRAGDADRGQIEAVNGRRLQIITWWPDMTTGGPEQADRAAMMRVVAGEMTR